MMNEEQIQQGRNTLIETLHWTPESISEFCRLQCDKDSRNEIKVGLLSDLTQIKVDIDALVDLISGITDEDAS